MNSDWSQLQIIACWIGAGLLFLVELGVAVALVSVNALNPVSLRRLGAETSRLEFVEQMQESLSPFRLAATVLRQTSLMGATMLVVLGSMRLEFSHPVLVGFVLSGLFEPNGGGIVKNKIMSLENNQLWLTTIGYTIAYCRWMGLYHVVVLVGLQIGENRPGTSATRKFFNQILGQCQAGSRIVA